MTSFLLAVCSSAIKSTHYQLQFPHQNMFNLKTKDSIAKPASRLFAKANLLTDYIRQKEHCSLYSDMVEGAVFS